MGVPPVQKGRARKAQPLLPTFKSVSYLILIPYIGKVRSAHPAYL
ncbi:hypothetical protein Osc7112_0100 [Oscillatoria nigro-viridis PCC 7112]|uniref:Uncharacterized protein n=1 Tax=Phormidium nigroviride PCC 7112 TaxID=179408 RepID=K9VBF3_9CYAN|nr:hypothetical protein Osc7112_0100 [Oscillatoria nigro-viridis PCC 7112]